MVCATAWPRFEVDFAVIHKVRGFMIRSWCDAVYEEMLYVLYITVGGSTAATAP